MSDVQTVTVLEDEAGMRLDRWFKVHFPNVKHGALEKLLRTGQIRVAGGRAKSSRRLEAGESVRVPPLPEDATASGPAKKTAAAPSAADIKALREMTLYEDAVLLVLNKPFGLAVQGGAKTSRHIDGMLAAIEKNGERPRLVHRLDRDTGGLLVLAKTRAAAASLGAAFQGRDIEKTYWALVAGMPAPREGTIDLSVAKRVARARKGLQERVIATADENAKRAITHYQLVDEAGRRAAFLALKPVTGRTHQLRVHCAAIDTPIVGDRKYGGEASVIDGVSDRLHLFCKTMSFPHPATGDAMTLTAPLTGHMRESWAFFGFDPDIRVEWPEIAP